MFSRVNRVEATAACLALFAHVGFVALHKVVPEVRVNLLGEALAPIEVEVEQQLFDQAKKETPLDLPTPSERPPQSPDAATRPPERQVIAAAGRIVSPSPVLTAQGAGEPGGDTIPVPPGSAPAPPGSGDAWSALPPGGAPSGLPGLNGKEVWTYNGALPALPAPVPAPTAVAAKPVERDIANKVLGDVLKDRDKKMGIDLPAAGSVASAVQAATYSHGTINEGRATFVITLGPGGKVNGVRVSSMSAGSEADWSAVANAVKASLASKTLALTGQYEKGAVVTVTITSKMQLPSGGKDFASLNGAGGTFDVTNIGTKQKRVVSQTFSVTPVK